jgi:PTS system nitrogen regulatory IIA component
MVLQPEQHSTESQHPFRIIISDDGAPKMVIRDFLSPADAPIEVRAPDKRRLLQDVASRAAAALDLPADRICNELLKREELGSTGTGGGIAIPHARMPEIKKPFGILVRLKQPIEFDAIDDQPVEIVFLLLLPAASAGEHLAALAVVARKLRDAATVRRLHQAGDAAELYRAMVEE